MFKMLNCIARKLAHRFVKSSAWPERNRSVHPNLEELEPRELPAALLLWISVTPGNFVSGANEPAHWISLGPLLANGIGAPPEPTFLLQA